MAEMEVLRALDAIFETFRSHIEGLMVIVPPINMFETPHDIVLQVALPGVKKEDIKLSFSDGYVTIKAYRRKMLSEQDMPHFKALEISSGLIRRRVFVGKEVDTENIQSTLEDGILEIRFPRKKSLSVELHIETEE